FQKLIGALKRDHDEAQRTEQVHRTFADRRIVIDDGDHAVHRHCKLRYLVIAGPIPRILRRATLTNANTEIQERPAERAPRGQRTDGAKSREQTPLDVIDTSADQSFEASPHT